MYCEKCGTKGYEQRQMQLIDDKIIGPCCAPKSENPGPTDAAQMEWGLELSSHLGLIAYAEYGPFRAEFRKTPLQLREMFHRHQPLELAEA